MIGRKVVLAGVVAAAALAGAFPAAAEDTPYFKAGVNTGDQGVISLAFNTNLATNFEEPTTAPTNSTCEYYEQGRPSSNDVVLVVEGHAHATPHASTATNRVVSIAIRCVLYDVQDTDMSDPVVDHTEATESMNAAWESPQIVFRKSTSYVICSSVRMDWHDGSVTQNQQLACQY